MSTFGDSVSAALGPPGPSGDGWSPAPAAAAARAAWARLRPSPRAAEADSRVAAAFAIEWTALLAALACVGVILAGSLWKSHGSVGAAERDRLGVQARVIGENVAQQLDGINRALASVRDEYLAAPPGSVGLVTSARMKALTDAIPGVRSMVLLDADGNVAATGVDTLLGRDFSDRDYFRASKTGHDPEALHVAAPFKTSLGTYTVVFSRAIVAPGGRFVGAVAAALEPEYFQVLMRSVLYAPDMWVSLAHRDGKVFVTMPRDAARLEADWQQTLASVAKRAGDGGGEGGGEGTGETDGAAVQLLRGPIGGSGDVRLTALRELAPGPLRMDRPLVIAVSRSESAVFRDWQRQSFEYAGFFGLLCIAAVFGLHRGHARRVEISALQAGAAEERQSHAEQLALALHSADIGLWNWDLATDRFTFDAFSVAHLGFPAEGVDRDDSVGRDWRDRIHRADAPRLLAALEAHFRGDVPGFECEYRVRHRDGSWVWLHSRGRIVERDAFGVPAKMTGTHLDIGERKRSEARIARTSEMLRRTGELANIGGWELDLASGQLEWTEQVFRIHELEPGEVPALDNAIAFYATEAQAQIAGAIETAAADGTAWDLELPFITAKGHARWVRTQGLAVMEDGRPARLLGAFQDITERKTTALELHRLNDQLQRLSTTDPLTDVGNRRLFDQTLRSEWARAARRGEPIGLLMIDIDHFKEYNDHYGHPAGDACLRQVARMVGQAMRRGGELVARYGGEEFALLLPGATAADALAAAKRCSQLLADAKIEHRASPTSAWVTVSIGVASQHASPDVECGALIDTADAALYRAKRCGRGRIEH